MIANKLNDPAAHQSTASSNVQDHLSNTSSELSKKSTLQPQDQTDEESKSSNIKIAQPNVHNAAANESAEPAHKQKMP